MQKIARYVFSGGIATVTSLLLTYLLTDVAGLWYVFSSIAGFSVAICISFSLQKFWTFQHREMTGIRAEAAQFVLVALGSLALDAVAVYGLVEYIGLHYLLAQFFIGCFLAIANFIFYHMIFRGAARRSLLVLWREELTDWERSLILAGGLAFFLVTLKFFGVALPYHQDEWKFAHFVVDPVSVAGIFHHPPLTELIFRIAGGFIPAELLRLIPLAFTAGSYGLLYLVLERRVGFRAAILSLVAVGISAYGTIAALMLDTDGAILPFFFLLSIYSYDRMMDSAGRLRILFGTLLLLAVILGFLVKLSFVLVVGALVLDYLYTRRGDITMREIGKLGGGLLLFGAVFGLLLIAAQIFIPTFDMGAMASHALSYVHGFQRNWGQIAFQAGKAFMYFGPLVWALAFVSRGVFDRTRIFFIYLGLGFLFYFVLFDFSQGALDKYLTFIIVPLCAIIGVTLAPYLPRLSEMRPGYVAALVLGGVGLLALNFLPQDVLPLYPKSAWAKEVLSLHWDILLPFMGGSGPAGFYVSFLFIAASFIVAGIMVFLALSRPALRNRLIGALVLISIVYAGVFTEELFFGRINGSIREVLQQSLDYIKKSDNVTSVITHNDIGAFELWRMGKYAGRFYAVPQYEDEHKVLFTSHTGQYLVVDMPKINDDSFYGGFFAKCRSLFEAKSGVIKSNIYSCPTVKP